MNYWLVAVYAFAFGVLVRDVAQDYMPTRVAQAKECEAHRENAERFATMIAQLLTEGGRLNAPGTEVSCRVKHTEENV